MNMQITEVGIIIKRFSMNNSKHHTYLTLANFKRVIRTIKKPITN